MPFNPINYGNIVTQGENILNSRAQRDPNSLQNQLLRAEIQGELNPTVNPSSQMKNDVYRTQIIADIKAGKRPKEDLQMFENWVAREKIIDIGNVPYSYSGGQSTALSSEGYELDAAATMKNREQLGVQGAKAGVRYDTPVRPTDINLGVQSAAPAVPSEAALAASRKSSEVSAALNAEAGLDPQGNPKRGATTKTDQAADQAAATTTSQGQAERGQDWINRASTAAEAYPVLGRAIQLLEGGTKTGGWDNVKLMATNFFGVTGANEAELSNNLGKAVLSQLRETFGAAFTVEEGRRLERIEANYGKSVEGNKRLLKQAQKVLNEVMKRGLKAAKDSQDTAAMDSINRGYTFDLSDPISATEKVDITTMTDEQLDAYEKKLRGE